MLKEILLHVLEVISKLIVSVVIGLFIVLMLLGHLLIKANQECSINDNEMQTYKHNRFMIVDSCKPQEPGWLSPEIRINLSESTYEF